MPTSIRLSHRSVRIRVVSAFDYILSRSLPILPRPLVRRVSRRYIAGDLLTDAVRVVRSLNGRGLMATLDVLGECLSSRSLVEGAVGEHLECLRLIQEERLDSNISVKPTQVGLKIDRALCTESIVRIVEDARQRGNFVRIDMEDSSCTTDTVELFGDLRRRGLDNVGLVLQAYMRRSLNDLRSLPEGSNVRLCKGIYVEPRSVAYQDRVIISRNFVRLLEEALDRRFYVGIATHDEELIWEAMRILDRRSVSPSAYEFQMLLGVDEQLRGLILQDGHRLRIYVPFGANWYAYSLRRLKENPRIAGYVLNNILSRNHG
jgi:proline dehydrogenase